MYMQEAFLSKITERRNHLNVSGSVKED